MDLAQLEPQLRRSLPEILKPGYVFKIPSVFSKKYADLTHWQVDGKPLIYDETSQTWLGSVGLHKRKFVTLTAVAPQRRTSESLRTAHVLIHSIQVDQPVVKTKSRLRIPASTWKRVSNVQKAEKQRYWKRIKEMRTNGAKTFTSSCWQRPLKRHRINSRFGSPRTLPNGHYYFHSGLDLKGWYGTPIYATSAGRVALVDESPVPGKTVAIDHGGGVFTQFMHLSKFKVKEGDLVSPGDLIGHVGATGRVEGPHLHWEIHLRGQKSDPLQFLQTLGRSCDPA